jgi:16S rRNA (cytosine967-C5)-methyltransferase
MSDRRGSAPRSARVAEPVSRVQPARRIALEVIMAVRETDAFANLLLPVKLERARLSPQDAALATELTYGTLRQQGYYDAVIELAAGRSTDEIDSPILDVLRLGTHQLLSMRVRFRQRRASYHHAQRAGYLARPGDVEASHRR